MAEVSKDGGGDGSLSLESALKAIKQLMPAIKMITEHAATLNNNPEDAPAAPAAAVDKEPEDGSGGAETAKEEKPSADNGKKAPEDPAATTAAQKAKEDREEGKKGEGMDAKPITLKSLFGEVSRRNALADKLSQHVGAFDHSEMTEAEVAVYGCKKLGLSVGAGQESAALTGYLAAAKSPARSQISHAQDGKPKGPSLVDQYLSGKKEA